jgi:hypothetical protein|tara:strand:+ start:448 stop:765 length:318 start_codon:yes stop_codon:yes gene_type:complete
MAKRKTPKQKDEVIDLTKPQNIEKEELESLQQLIKSLDMAHLELGVIEHKKHLICHDIMTINKFVEQTKKGFEKKYGTADINVKTGEIKYNKDADDKTDKKDNDR